MTDQTFRCEVDIDGVLVTVQADDMNKGLTTLTTILDELTIRHPALPAREDDPDEPVVVAGSHRTLGTMAADVTVLRADLDDPKASNPEARS